jgi:AcrR family transcriptional regulator
MLQLTADEGYESVTVRKLATLAGVSSASFYASFDGKEECFLRSCSLVLERIRARVQAARSYDQDCHPQLKGTIEAFLAEPTEDPEIARVALVDLLDGGPAASASLRDFEGAIERAVKDNLSRRGVPVSPAVAGWITAGCFRASRTLLTDSGFDQKELTRRLSTWGACFLEDIPTAIEARHAASDADVETGRDAIGEHRRFEERQRVLGAVTKLAAKSGYWQLRVSAIRKQAGVSRRSFDAQFAGVESCFLASIEELARSYLSSLIVSADSPTSWGEEVCRAVAMLTRRLAAEPEKARLAFVGILDPGPSGLQLRERLIGEFAATWEASVTPTNRRNPLAAEATLAAFWGAIAQGLDPVAGETLYAGAPTLVFFLLAPSLGPDTARRLSNHAEELGNRRELVTVAT